MKENEVDEFQDKLKEKREKLRNENTKSLKRPSNSIKFIKQIYPIY